MFYLVRHGQTDYSERNTKIYQGFGVNLSPLSYSGIEEVKKTSHDERLQTAEIILSSPYTRAVQTAAILSKELQLDIRIETELHEWLANKNYIYEPDKLAESHFKEFMDSSGQYPEGEDREWEDCIALRRRLKSVLLKYQQFHNVIVVCHGMLIQSVGKGRPETGGIVELDINEFA